MDNTNSGVLFNNTDDWKIVQQGKLNIEAEEHRIIGVKRNNKDGQPIIELYRAIGTLKANPDKQGDKSPDAKGVINKIIDKGAMTISAWRDKSQSGNPFTSLKLRDFSNEVNQSSTNESRPMGEKQVLAEDELNDKIPF